MAPQVHDGRRYQLQSDGRIRMSPRARTDEAVTTAGDASGDQLDGDSIFSTSQRRERFVDGVLAWLVSRQAYFEPPQEDLVVDQAPDAIVQGRGRKAFGELGAALRLARRVPELWRRDEVRRLAGWWSRMLRERKVYFDARRRVRLFPQMSVALAVQAAIEDAPDEAARAALQSVLDRGFMDRVERSAWQKLDLKYYFDAAGLAHRFDRDSALMRQSSLAAPPALAWSNTMDLYGLTHLIFHLTDFAARPMPAAREVDPAALDAHVALALAMCLAERDFDLVAELLMSRICLGRRGDALNRAAAEALCAAQQPEGFIPDRSWRANPSAEPQAVERAFFGVYHPTLVALFLVACDMAAPTAPAPPPGQTAAAVRIDVRAAAGRAAGYAVAVMARAADQRTQVECLALAHLACVLDPSPATLAARREVAAGAGAPNWLASDLLTGLLAAAGALANAPALAHSAARYVALLAELDAADSPPENAALVRRALWGGEAAGETATLALERAPQDACDLAVVAQTASAIEAASRFGLIPLACEAPLPILLEGASLAALRAYDLPLGMRLLRARRYLGRAATPGVAAACEFLVSSQGPGGGFGDYDGAVAAIAVRGGRDGDAQLRLPVTLQALWTLAEIGGVSVFREVFGADGLAGRAGR